MTPSISTNDLQEHPADAARTPRERCKNAPLVMMAVGTPAGQAHAVITPEDETLRLFGWGDPADNLHRLPAELAARGVEQAPGPVAIREAIERYGDGDLTALASLAVDQPGGAFFQDAWRALREVTPGATVTYTDLATRAGRPAAVRAAASACARNLVALVVPCHRIVRRDGGLGGFYYGLPAKQLLLAHEARWSESA